MATLWPPSTKQLAGANISLLAARGGRLRVLQQRPERGRTCRRRRTTSPGRAVRLADRVPATVIHVVILLSTVVLSRYPLKMTVDTRIVPRTRLARRRLDQALHLAHLRQLVMHPAYVGARSAGPANLCQPANHPADRADHHPWTARRAADAEPGLHHETLAGL